jgi:hypothetical protein
MNTINPKKRMQIIELRAQGMSIREIARTVGCAKETVERYGLSHFRIRIFRMFEKLGSEIDARGISAMDIPGFTEIYSALAFECPRHPEADAIDDVDPELGCRLCKRDGMRRHHEKRRAEGRTIVPPLRKSKKPSPSA